MLIIDVEEQEFYDSKKEMFFYAKPITVRLEHSLISIAKWEAYWEKPYLPTSGKTEGISGYSEEVHYVRCMIIGNVPNYIPEVLYQNHSEKVQKHITKKQSGTTIYRRGKTPPSTQIVTSELIYYWMIKFGIPFDCERWHFNRLLMLLDVCSIKESKDKKGNLSSMDAAKHRHALNKARQAGL